MTSRTAAAKPPGKLLAALREACDSMTQHQLADATAVLAAQDPTRYVQIKRSSIGNFETGEIAQKDNIRVTLAAVFGITADEFRSYLAGELSLDDVLEIRRRLENERSQPTSGVTESVGAPRLKTHPRWAELCMQAMAIDPQLRPETLTALGDKPFFYGPLENVDAYLLVEVGRGIQSWKRRAP